MPFGNLKDWTVVNHRVTRRPRRARNATTAAKVKRIAKKVNQMKPEVKYITEDKDFLLRTDNATQNAVIQQKLFTIARGDGLDERIGSKIRSVGWEFMYALFNTGPLSQAAFFRVCLVYDNNPNQTRFQMNMLFDPHVQPGPFPVAFSDITLRNRQYLQRFNIVYDKIGTIGDPGLSAAFTTALPAGGNDRCLKNFRTSKKHNKKIIYTEDGATGAIAQTIKGAFYLLTWCSIDNQLQISATIRLKYTDV